MGFPGGSSVKETANAEDSGSMSSILGLGSSLEGGNGNPLQYSMEDSIDRGAWQATVHGVTRVGHNLATKPPPHGILLSHKKENI